MASSILSSSSLVNLVAVSSCSLLVSISSSLFSSTSPNSLNPSSEVDSSLYLGSK